MLLSIFIFGYVFHNYSFSLNFDALQKNNRDRRIDTSLIGAIDFGDLRRREEEMAQRLDIGSGRKAHTERTLENAIVRIELDALQLILRMLHKNLSDVLQHTCAVDAFNRKRGFIEMRGGLSIVPLRGNDIVAETRFVLERDSAITAMELEMVVAIDVSHHFISLDGVTMATKFTMIEHLIGKRERSFAIEMFHKIGVEVILHLERFGLRSVFEERHKATPSPSSFGLFAEKMLDVELREHQLSFT